MYGVHLREPFRWKEWIPLVTQQQRLRNLMQVIAYNIRPPEELRSPKKGLKLSYYFTLHLSTMSSPLYSSEKLESENPKWAEFDVDHLNGSVNGVILRLWVHCDGAGISDSVITIWGVYFSGLVYLGPKLFAADPGALTANTIVFHMNGGYFTAPYCFINPHPATPWTLSIQLSASQVKTSYSVKLLLRLQTMQQAIKKQTQATYLLREKISAGAITSDMHSFNEGRESAILRRIMNQPVKPRPPPQEILEVKRQIEMLQFRVNLLKHEKEQRQASLRQRVRLKESLMDQNEDRGNELMSKYFKLKKDLEKYREYKKQLLTVQCNLNHESTLLDIRRKELMSELSYIYPIVAHPDGRYTIREVHLPNSEDFDGKNELMISVALGFVAHLVQMLSYFLNVPTRYPICHFGSRSKMIDHIIDKIRDEEREFPLYSKKKEKFHFQYGVFLLNKNIAQLRWCCGMSTGDLRATLPNLAALMNMSANHNGGTLFERRNVAETLSEVSLSGLSFSLDEGLNFMGGNLSPEQTDSDPQSYLKSHREAGRSRHDTMPAPSHDLASLMSLDLPPRTFHAANGLCNTLTHEPPS